MVLFTAGINAIECSPSDVRNNVDPIFFTVGTGLFEMASDCIGFEVRIDNDDDLRGVLGDVLPRFTQPGS